MTHEELAERNIGLAKVTENGKADCGTNPEFLIEDGGPCAVSEYRRAVVDAFEQGFEQAMRDYGIWKDGVQRIGCRNQAVTEILEERHAARGGGE